MTAVVTFEQRVKERIDETIASLIPDEELARLVEAQVAHFRAHKLNEMILKELHEKMALAVRAELAKPEYQSFWDTNGNRGASMAVTKLIEENAGAMLVSMMGGMVQMTISQMQSNMPRY